ncbi:alpha-L-rhamnosidase-like [Oppia nitens]|uniref:alpha-L-rhamnosidase-like n=1 Tax=Oppia nitens TaxID=1686743 RepID=UPI0023DC194C|nr:alpha-L-rhamnosidase-like [Oppia nitens]
MSGQLLGLFSSTTSIKCCDISVSDLKVEYLVNPLAVDIPGPRLQWLLQAIDHRKHNLWQSAYQILVATDTETLLQKNTGNLWDSGKVVSNQSNHIEYKGRPLSAGQLAYWMVKVWDQDSRESNYSTIAYWGNGLGSGSGGGGSQWSGQWISAPNGLQQEALKQLADIDKKVVQDHQGLLPMLYMRKQFSLGQSVSSSSLSSRGSRKVKRAILYATAQGVYKVWINNKLVADHQLSPGWTDYLKTYNYQSYDVTELLLTNASTTTDNTIGVLLGTGWYSGYIGLQKNYAHYGRQQSFWTELHVQYDSGDREDEIIIKSDQSWKVGTGSLMYSDMLHGQLYYEHLEPKNWRSTGFDDSKWPEVVARPVDDSKHLALLADPGVPIRVIEELIPVAKWQSSPGVWVFDFGQNAAGWIQLRRPTGAARVQIRHAEALNPNGSIYTLNLRSVLATDTYVFTDTTDAEEEDTDTVEPHFTFHGYRYVELVGYPDGEPKLTDLKFRVIHSDTPMLSKLVTSDQLVNQLISNIKWGQRSNFLSVPTDCPQRDERMGWMGDAEIFAPTASYMADVSAFYTKWLRDVRDGQSPEGGFSDVAPRMVDPYDGAPAWGDAGVILPYTMLTMFGDHRIVDLQWPSMEKWFQYIAAENPDHLWTKRVNNNYGDWLQVNARTPKEVMNTAYYGYDALLMSRMASVTVNRTADVLKYRQLHQSIAQAFNREFVNQTDGRIAGDTQTGYLLALAFELLPERLRPLAVNHLVDNIRAHDWHLTTGFIGVGYLCPTLSEFGRHDVALRLLLQDTYPSWGYSIRNNATTIWERWDGWTRDKGFQDPGMNSFNHYSLGSVGRWLWQSLAGIDNNDSNGLVTGGGFKDILIDPKPGANLYNLTANYQSINGQIDSSWISNGTHIKFTTTIPVNTRATIDVTFIRNETIHRNVGSGRYEFMGQLNKQYDRIINKLIF